MCGACSVADYASRQRAGVCQCAGFKTLVRSSCSGSPTSPVSCLDRLFVFQQIAGSVTESWGPSRLTEPMPLFIIANTKMRPFHSLPFWMTRFSPLCKCSGEPYMYRQAMSGMSVTLSIHNTTRVPVLANIPSQDHHHTVILATM